MTQAFNRDCMEAMREFPDKFFDLAIVDPPYGIGISKSKNIGKRGKTYSTINYKVSNWDNKIPEDHYFKELFRVSRNQIIWGGNYFTQFLPPSMGWIFWDKVQPEGISFAMGELAWTSFNRSLQSCRISIASSANRVSNNKAVALANSKIHPTQKPVRLYKWILKNYSEPGMKILDTHLGSGSSRIAAHDMGYDFWGYELDPEYFAAQEKRFAQHISQPQISYGVPKAKNNEQGIIKW